MAHPMIPTRSGAIAAAVLALSLCAWGCASPGTRDARQAAAKAAAEPRPAGQEPAAPTVKPAILIGRVVAVNEDERFVLFETGSRRRKFPTGFRLEARPAGAGETIPLRFSPEHNQSFATADYDGETPPRTGDFVFTVPSANPEPSQTLAEAISVESLEPVEPLEPLDADEALRELVDGSLVGE